MKVSEWLQKHPRELITVQEGCTLDQATSRILSESCVKDIYVVNGEQQIIGHIPFMKLARLTLAEHSPIHTRSQIMERVTCGCACDLMETHFASADPSEEMDETLHRLLEHHIEDMPVINGQGDCLGAINLLDVLAVKLKD